MRKVSLRHFPTPRPPQLVVTLQFPTLDSLNSLENFRLTFILVWCIDPLGYRVESCSLCHLKIFSWQCLPSAFLLFIGSSRETPDIDFFFFLWVRIVSDSPLPMQAWHSSHNCEGHMNEWVNALRMGRHPLDCSFLATGKFWSEALWQETG